MEEGLGLSGLGVLKVVFGLVFPGPKSVVVSPVLELVPSSSPCPAFWQCAAKGLLGYEGLC